MSLPIVAGNGEFLSELSLSQETICAEKLGPKRGDTWLAGQIFENQDNDDIFNRIGGSICWTLETDDNNLITCGQQNKLSVATNRSTEFFHTLCTLSKVI